MECFKVLKVLDNGRRVVINAGSKQGIESSDRFLIFDEGERIIDPDTNEDLGTLEIKKGMARPYHIQDKIATLESFGFKIRKDNHKNLKSLLSIYPYDVYGNRNIEENAISFDGVQVDDLVKKI